MAQKRMFDKAIVDTDTFMDLSMTAKALYFLLGMEADDEGFVSYKKVMRIHGGNDDDIKILILKNFIIHFDSGVVVITDWNSNNWLDSRRTRPTVYQNEKAQLYLTESKKYVLSNGLESIEEYRVEEKSIEQTRTVTSESEKLKKEDKRNPEIQELWEYGTSLCFTDTKQNLNRFAIKRLLTKHTLPQLKSAAKFATSIKSERYAPQISSWLDLEDKYEKLKNYADRKKLETNSDEQQGLVVKRIINR